jgi:hypothetical protein
MAETARFQTTLSRRTIDYLRALAKKGTHGSSIPGVGRSLIEIGIREAIKDGLIVAEEGQVSDDSGG